MSGLPPAHLSGEVVEDVLTRNDHDGTRCLLKIDCVERRNEKGSWVDARKMRVGVTCRGRLAENVVKSVRKGDRVMVEGVFVTVDWLDGDGNPRSAVQVEARNIGVDLLFAPRPHRSDRKGAERGRFEDMAPQPVPRPGNQPD